MKQLTLSVLPQRLAVCRFPPSWAPPPWIHELPLWSVTRTDDELSLVVPEEKVPEVWKAERGWRALKVEGPLDFGLTGILASLAVPLAESQISIFALSTYDTDIVLIPERELEEARVALEGAGHVVTGG